MKLQTILFLLLTSLVTTRAADRVISANLEQVEGSRSMTWQDCVGAGRVAEGLRGTWQRQLKECKDTIGFKYLRMHGLLSDELGGLLRG